MSVHLPLAAVLGFALALAGCAQGSGRGMDRFERERLFRADPSRIVAAELALARAAQEDGQWTALAEYATGDAVMFVPQAVNARDWLRTQQNPAQAVRWQPHQVWSSCDGTLAATRGAWQGPGGSNGYFTTVWQRQGRGGEYEWVMDQADTLAEPLPPREMIGTQIAACRSQPTPPPEMLAGPSDTINGGASRDGTLRWTVVVRADHSRTVAASYWNGTSWEDAFRDTVAAP
jgi:hypothetical protein